MTIFNDQKKFLHVAKAKLKLDDDLYRQTLVKIAGVTSSVDLDAESFAAVMGFFQSLGFDPLKADGPNYGHRTGFASPAQAELIRTLWREAHNARQLDEAALNGWLLKYWKVSSMRFVTVTMASKLITALKAWKSRAA